MNREEIRKKWKNKELVQVTNSNKLNRNGKNFESSLNKSNIPLNSDKSFENFSWNRVLNTANNILSSKNVFKDVNSANTDNNKYNQPKRILVDNLQDKTSNLFNKVKKTTGDYAKEIGRSAVLGSIEPVADITSLAYNLPTKLGNSIGLETVQQKNARQGKGISPEDFTKGIQKIKSNEAQRVAELPKGQQIASRWSRVIGNMIPSILAGQGLAIGNTSEAVQQSANAISSFTSALYSGASTYDETLNEEQDNYIKAGLKAGLYGFATNKIEGITGGNLINKFGSLDDIATKGISKVAKNELQKKILSSVYSAFGETIEENLENWVDHLIDFAFGDAKDITAKSLLEEAKQTSIDTAMVNFIMQAIGLGGGTYNDVKMYEAQKKIDSATFLNENQKIAMKEVLETEGNPNVADYLLKKEYQKLQDDNTKNNEILNQEQQNKQNMQEQKINGNTSIQEDIDLFKEATENIGKFMTAEEQIKAIENLNDGELKDTKSRIVPKKTKEKITLKDLNREFQKQFINKDVAVDELAKKIGNKELLYKNDRRHLAFNEAQVSIGVNQVNINGEIIGESLLSIYNEAEKIGIDQSTFDDYLLNRTNIERSKYEKGLYGESITAKDSEAIIKAYEEKFPEINGLGKKISNYNDNNLKILKDGGFISNELYTKLRQMYEDYVPAIVDIIETPGLEEADNVGYQVLKRAKGNDKNILSPKESMASQTVKYVEAYRNNETLKELYKTIKSNVNDLYENEEILDIADAEFAINNAVGYDELKKKYTATIFENGELKTFEISKDIYDAFVPNKYIKGIQENKIANLIGTVASNATQEFKALTTGKNILYALKNMVKDFNDAPINSTTNIANFYYNWVVAYNEIISNGKYYQEYKNAGGGANTYFDYKEGLLPGKKNIAQKMINEVEMINQVVETAPRLAEYIATRKRGGSINEALYNAAEVTTNFKRGGELAKVVDKYAVPYFNASIQGLDKQIRNITEANNGKALARLIINSAIAGIAPGVINHLLLDDDKEYEKLPDYIKDNYYLIKINGNQDFARIPKGRVAGMLGATAVRTIRRFQGDNKAYNDYFSNVIWNNIGFNNPFMNNLLSPYLQASNNEAWYGGSIYSKNKYEGKLPLEITDEKVDKFSNWVAKTLYDILPERTYKKLSDKDNGSNLFKVLATPKLLNYVMDQYSGFIGDFALPFMTPYAENNPFIDQFTTSSTLKNKYVSEFYDIMANSYPESEYATDTDKLTYKYLLEISKETGKLYGKKAEIQSNTNLTDKEKRTKSYEIQKQINSIMEESVKTVEDLKIDSNYAKFSGREYYKDNEGDWKEITIDDKIEGLSTNIYADYKNSISKANKNKREQEEKNLVLNEKISILNNATYSNKEKELIYMNDLGKEDNTYKDLKTLGFKTSDIEKYLTYKTIDFESDKENDGTKNGKTVSGSKAKKILSYLDSIDLEEGIKVYLYASNSGSTKLTEKQKNIFESYIKSLHLTPNKQKRIYMNLGSKNVVEMNDGTIKWK